MTNRRPFKKVAKKKTTRQDKRPSQFSIKGGIKVYRSGLEGGDWYLVDDQPDVVQSGRSVSIGSNIAVDKSALRQSVVNVTISEEALIGLFEKQFGITGKGIGNLVSDIERLRETSSALLHIIDYISNGYFLSIVRQLESIPRDPDLFSDPDDIKVLRRLTKYKWKRD
jgi:hypothetical protein